VNNYIEEDRSINLDMNRKLLGLDNEDEKEDNESHK